MKDDFIATHIPNPRLKVIEIYKVKCENVNQLLRAW